MPELLKPFVITVVGPESSGKTTLARELAHNLGCPWVPEYARAYLSELGRTYHEQDLLKIAEGQLAAISAAQSEISTTYASINVPQALDLIRNYALKAEGGKAFVPFSLTGFGTDPRPLLIVDSGMLSIKLWAEIKFGTVLPEVEKALENDNTDLYLLCRPLWRWADDPLREAPELLDRAWIYNQFLKNLFIKQMKSSSMWP